MRLNGVLIPVPRRELSVVMRVCFHSNPPSARKQRRVSQDFWRGG